MNNATKGICGIVLILAVAVSLGAGRHAPAADQDADVAQAKAVRTAGVDVAIGSFTCRGAATGEVTAAIDYQGTAGVLAASTGFGISVNAVVEPVDAELTCSELTEGLVDLAAGLNCTTSQVRFIGVTRDFVFVCSGITDTTNGAVAQTARYIAANVRSAGE